MGKYPAMGAWFAKASRVFASILLFWPQQLCLIISYSYFSQIYCLSIAILMFIKLIEHCNKDYEYLSIMCLLI